MAVRLTSAFCLCCVVLGDVVITEEKKSGPIAGRLFDGVQVQGGTSGGAGSAASGWSDVVVGGAAVECRVGKV